MTTVDIKSGNVDLILTSPRSGVRISDAHGNHVSRPVSEGKFDSDFFIEWMITNAQVSQLIQTNLNDADKENLRSGLKQIDNFIKDSNLAQRKAEGGQKEAEKFLNFDVRKFVETFYSFEQEVQPHTRVRIIFKMGDFTLAPHMFVLLSFSHLKLKLGNRAGEITSGALLGSGAKAVWQPSKEEIKAIVLTLATASANHRDDLLRLI